MATTYTPEDLSSFDALAVYSDAAATVLVETLTVPADVGVGLYETAAELTDSLYTLGTVYFLKATWTPSGAVQRSMTFPFLYAPLLRVFASSGSTTTAKDGTRLQAPQMQLRVGRDAFHDAYMENAVQAVRNRFEAEFPLGSAVRSRQVYLVAENFCAHEPYLPVALVVDIEEQSPSRAGREAS